MFLQELQYFITVAEHLSFTGAAKQLFITQSGLSKHVIKMEEELGIQLFRRGSRPLELTANGAEFFSLAKTFLYGCNALKAASNENEAGPILGTISIAAPVHYGHYGHMYISKCIDRFRGDLQNVNLQLDTGATTDLIKGLLNGELDFLITSDPTLYTIQGTEKTLLQKRKRKIILPKDHPLASSNRLSVGDLRDEGFMIVKRGDLHNAFDSVINLCNCFGFYPSLVTQPENFDILYMLVEAGKGVTISSIVPDLNMCPNLKMVEIDEEGLPEQAVKDLDSDLYIMWRSDNTKPSFKKIIDKIRN